MTRQEFLDGLAEALAGEVTEQTILDQVTYYRSYIDGQIASGRAEADVLAELGSPRLIARTIADSEEAKGDQGGSQKETYTQQSAKSESGAGKIFSSLNIDEKTRMILLIVIAVLVLLCVIGTVLKIISSPLGITLIVAVCVYGYLTTRRRK